MSPRGGNALGMNTAHHSVVCHSHQTSYQIFWQPSPRLHHEDEEEPARAFDALALPCRCATLSDLLFGLLIKQDI
jgi:hypothetical protein